MPFTTDVFDATQVDATSVMFAGAFAMHGGHFEDVDGDGRDDLILHFALEETNLRDIYFALLEDDLEDGELDSRRQEYEASLTGETLGGQLFEGSDSLDLFLSGNALRDALASL